MKKTWKIWAIAIMLVFSVVSVFAAGRTENATRDPAKNSAQSSSSAQTETVQSAPTNQSAQTGAATQANQAAQSAPTTTESNKNSGKLYMELPAGTDGTAGKSAKYVLFGEYPQTIMAEGVTINKNKTRQAGEFTYYQGSDGAWYYEAEEHSFDYFEYDDAYLGIECLYSDGSERNIYDWAEPTTRFFKVEPIKWRVLTDNYQGKMLLIPEVILTAGIAYNENDRIDRYPNDYEASTIRAYLNGEPYYSMSMTGLTDDGPIFAESANNDYVGIGFLQTAFSDDEQKAIAVTDVDNSLEQHFKHAEDGSVYIPSVIVEYRESFGLDGIDTKDKVFLLSLNEIIEYMAEDEIENIEATDFALANGAFYFSSWWLRSPLWCNLEETDDDIYYDSIIKVVYGSYMWGDETYGGYYSDTVDGSEYDDNCLVPVICIEK